MHAPTYALRLYELKWDIHILEICTLPNKTMTPLSKNKVQITILKAYSTVSTRNKFATPG